MKDICAKCRHLVQGECALKLDMAWAQKAENCAKFQKLPERLGGTRTPINKVTKVSKLHVHVLPDMSTALKLAHRRYMSRHTADDDRSLKRIGERPVVGDPARLKKAEDMAERLVEEALEFDPRLARKAQWVRRDEGEHVCAAAIATGDDQPFYKRVRSVVNEATAAGEPLRIVISTDDNNVPAGTAAAFIAVSRLVQQFIPIEVWWQGAWLQEDHIKGYVFMVPLVNGDMDYSRLEYCIADPTRDSFSYHVMITHAILDLKETNDGCGHRAQCAYHPTERTYSGNGKSDYAPTTKFISHHGISPNAESIAATAAAWLGWDSIWTVKYAEQTAASSAGQAVPQESNYKYVPPDAATEARWRKQEEDSKLKALKEASERMTVAV